MKYDKIIIKTVIHVHHVLHYNINLLVISAGMIIVILKYNIKQKRVKVVDNIIQHNIR